MPTLVFKASMDGLSRLVHTVLQQRLGQNYPCVHSHDCEQHHSGSRRVVSIVRQGVLLERWTLMAPFYDEEDSSSSSSSSSSTAFLDALPAAIQAIRGVRSVHLSVPLGHSTPPLDYSVSSWSEHPSPHPSSLLVTPHCSSHLTSWQPLEFSPDSQVYSHQVFHSSSLQVDCVISDDTRPRMGMRRLSRLSLSAMEQEDASCHPPSFAVPIPSSPMQYTHHGHSHGMAYSTSPSLGMAHSPLRSLHRPIVMASYPRRSSLSLHPHAPTLPSQPTPLPFFLHDHGPLVGSYEESLVSGRMSTLPSKPISFHCRIGVIGYDCKPSLKCPPHLSIVFPASFYELKEEKSTHPIEACSLGDGYRIPPKGQLQIVIKNPNKTPVKLFLIPYDVTDMPRNTKTFLRQKSYAQDNHLKYCVHVHLCRKEKRVYLYKTVRVVFAHGLADWNEKLRVVCEGPTPVYAPLVGDTVGRGPMG
ncbi:hypothetical protein BDF14DRAFT_1749685 [Spinellus fusiger]|nr:hypothetical protein BDF14DRAFT_1749685 [Spinellus fusiger]